METLHRIGRCASTEYDLLAQEAHCRLCHQRHSVNHSDETSPGQPSRHEPLGDSIVTNGKLPIAKRYGADKPSVHADASIKHRRFANKKTAWPSGASAVVHLWAEATGIRPPC